MRAAVIFGLGTSPADLKRFQTGSTAEWVEGLPASSNDADAVLIFGGDGTIHRHLSALVRLQLPVLVVPSGSGNDFARALALRSLEDSLCAWRNFESRKTLARAVDLGRIIPSGAADGQHYFCCVASCGLDAAAARRANKMPRWLRAHGGYALALVPLLFNLPEFSLRLTHTNSNHPTEQQKRTLFTAFANTPYYGDGMRVAPEADFTDGKLDICRVGPMNPIQLLYMFPTVYFGRHLLSPKVEHSQSERVLVETDSPAEIYADGEFVCKTPAEITVEPGALKVILPE